MTRTITLLRTTQLHRDSHLQFDKIFKLRCLCLAVQRVIISESHLASNDVIQTAKRSLENLEYLV